MSTRYPVGRFAPSPSGELHLGSLLAAVGSWLSVKSQGGRWLVRIEDLDPPREKPGAATQILKTLAAFGLQSDGPVLYQSQRGAEYAAALDKLKHDRWLYACSCSRKALADVAIYPRHCVGGPLELTRPLSLRVRVGDAQMGFIDQICGAYWQQLDREVGDFVLRRADGLHAYQLAVVVDDAAQGITEVVRGADLLDSTPRQIWLQQLLGLPTPRYAHLPLVLDEAGNKLSKSAAALAVDPSNPLPSLRWVLAALVPSSPTGDSPQALLHTALNGFIWRQMPRTIALDSA